MDYLAFFIIAVLQSYKSCVSVTVKRKYVDSTIKLVNAMTLECVYPKTATISQMSWIKEKDNAKEKIAVFKFPYHLHIESRYKFRVHVSNNTMSNKSLVFSNTTKEDTGFYLCSFQTFPYGLWEKRIEVIQSGDFDHHILLDLHIVTEPGKNVTFTHSYDPGIVVNQVVWKRIKPDRMDFIVHCANSNIPIYGSDYQDRVEMDCAMNTNHTSIVLWNITASDSGMYHCYYAGANGHNASGWIKLTIDGSVALDYEHHILFIVGTATLPLIIILAIVVMILHYRKKKRKIFMQMKTFSVSQNLSLHQCGKSGYGSKVNSSTKSGTTEEQIYVNYSGFAHRHNMQM